MSLNIDVSATADINPYIFGGGWSNLYDTWKVVSNVLKPTFSGSGISIAIATSPPGSGLLDGSWTTNHSNTVYSDFDGIAFCNSSGNGYVCYLNGDIFTVYTLLTGSPTTNVGHVSGLTYSAGASFRATYDLAANSINIYQNSVSTTTPAATYTGLTPATGMSNGIFTQWANSGAAGIITATVAAAAANSLNTLSSPVSVGGTGYIGTTSGMGTVTSLTNAAIGTASVGSFAFSMNSFSNGVAYLPMGSQTFTASDGTLTVTKASTVQTMSGYTSVLLSTMNTGAYSLGKDAATQFIYPQRQAL